MLIMARRFSPEFERDVVTVARRSDATFLKLTSVLVLDELFTPVD
jgi:hypothetical protein